MICLNIPNNSLDIQYYAVTRFVFKTNIKTEWNSIRYQYRYQNSIDFCYHHKRYNTNRH